MTVTKTLTCTAALLATFAAPVLAEGDLTRQDAIVITIDVGAKDGMAWEPSDLSLETGKLYQLILKNSSEYQIDVASPGLVDRIFTRKVQSYAMMDGEMQRTAEIKGNITEFEVFAGQQIDWWFVPVRTTRSPVDVCCTTEDDAVAATIAIK